MKKTNNERNLKSNEELERENEEVINEETHSNLEAIKEELEDQASEVTSEKSQDDCEGTRKSEELKLLQKEVNEYKERYLRLNAEFQNYKKRTEREKTEIHKYGSERIVKDILPIIDNLERALKSSEEGNEKGIKEGIEMVYKQFDEVLKKHGIEEIESMDMEFDPMLHHAVMQEECEDKESNTIIEVFQKGYKIDSKVIRPSMVKVVQ